MTAVELSVVALNSQSPPTWLELELAELAAVVVVAAVVDNIEDIDSGFDTSSDMDQPFDTSAAVGRHILATVDCIASNQNIVEPLVDKS